MWDAMRSAPLGDDVLGDEPTVARLETMIAARIGKEAAVFVPSGTMANQLAIRVACGAGDEIIAHEESHIIHYETGGPAALSGAMVRTVRGDGGLFDADDVTVAVRTRNIHHPVSKMLVAENTQNRGGGTVWGMDRWERVAREAHAHGLHVHVDGARLFNACVAGGYSAATFQGTGVSGR
jgi:threonine aldolase